jgi:Lipid A 3-O-deacylase (PagL)
MVIAMRLRALSTLVFGLTFAPQRVGAQTRANWDLSVEAMGSPTRSRPGFFFGGQVRGVGQSGIAIRASTDLVKVGPMHLRYTAQLLPMTILSHVERYELLESPDRSIYVLSGTANAYGVGLSPIGLQLAIDLASRVRAQFGTAAGLAVFTQHIPSAGGARRNFSAEWDATLQVAAGRDRWVQLGVRWKHISNGFTGYENPGVDNRMIVVGYSTRVGGRR